MRTADQPRKGTLVVTGASGFIALRLVSTALERGWSVRALARHPEKLDSVSGARFTAVRWDLADAHEQREALEGATVLCHLAAFIPPDHSDPRYATECFRANVLGTLNVLEAAKTAGVERLIHYSSGNVYAPRPALVVESDPAYPSHQAPFYLTSKLAAEVYVEYYRIRQGLSACVLRPSSVYGPGMKPNGLVSTFAKRLLAGESIVVDDGGRYTVDLVYVDDVVRATLLVAEKRVEGILNVGSGTLTTTLEVARTMIEVTGASPEQIRLLPADESAPPPGFAGLDVTRAREELGFQPTPLRRGLQRYIESLE